MLVFFRGNGPIASLIRWQTRGEYAHVGWLCEDGTFFESHAQTGVVHVAHPWVNNRGEADIYYVHGLTFEHRGLIEQFCASQIGAGYDWLGVARFVSGINRNNWRRWFCSELVAEACETANFPLQMTDAWRLNPVTLSWSPEIQKWVSEATYENFWKDKYGKK